MPCSPTFLLQFEDDAGDRLCRACSVIASNQHKAENLLKAWNRKNDRLRIFIKVRDSPVSFHQLTVISNYVCLDC